jgi:hypothetical protein
MNEYMTNFDLTICASMNECMKREREREMRERNCTLVKSLECFQNRWKRRMYLE